VDIDPAEYAQDTGDYTTVTEIPGVGAQREQMSMLYTRYRTAAEVCRGKDVLEVACGSGMGLGYLARKARRVVGGDYDGRLLHIAGSSYGGRIPLLQLDAQALPFQNSSFDVVILFEAIYYLRKVDWFLDEARRVMRNGGLLVICSANKERRGFQPSPFSVSYFSVGELRGLLTRHGFLVDLFAAFPLAAPLSHNSRSAARWLADALGLNPRVKAFLKRVLFGKPLPFPGEVSESMADLAPLVPLPDDSVVAGYYILYAIGRQG